MTIIYHKGNIKKSSKLLMWRHFACMDDSWIYTQKKIKGKQVVHWWYMTFIDVKPTKQHIYITIIAQFIYLCVASCPCTVQKKEMLYILHCTYDVYQCGEKNKRTAIEVKSHLEITCSSLLPFFADVSLRMFFFWYQFSGNVAMETCARAQKLTCVCV